MKWKKGSASLPKTITYAPYLLRLWFVSFGKQVFIASGYLYIYVYVYPVRLDSDGQGPILARIIVNMAIETSPGKLQAMVRALPPVLARTAAGLHMAAPLGDALGGLADLMVWCLTLSIIYMLIWWFAVSTFMCDVFCETFA